MTTRCLIDTNVLIDYLDGSAASAFVVNVEQALAMGSVVSVITTMELLGWRGHSAQSRRDAENLLHSMGEVGLTREVVTVLSRGKPVATIAPVRLKSEQRQSAKRALLARLSQQKALGKRTWSREQLYEA